MRARIPETAGGSEDASERVVVLGQDRVELVVVAASASDGQAQHGLRDHFDLLVVHVVEHARLVLLGDRFGAEREKAGSDDALAVHAIRIVRRQQVAGNLLAHEPVVGHVVVERVDDVVAVLPCVGVPVILVVAGGVGVAGDVQPVPAPALAVQRGGEEPLDHSLVSLRRIVVEKRRGFLRGRRYAGEVERGAAQPRQFRGRRRGSQSLLLELGQHEAVDRLDGPVGCGHRWQLRVRNRLECPIVPLLGGEPALLSLRDHRFPLFRAGPRSAHPDPVVENLEIGRRELAAGRHLDSRVVVDDSEQAARSRVLGRDQRGFVSSLDEALDPGEIDVPALELGVVARLALGGQQRAHVLLEVLQRLGVGVGAEARDIEERVRCEGPNRQAGGAVADRRHRGLPRTSYYSECHGASGVPMEPILLDLSSGDGASEAAALVSIRKRR